MPDQIADNVIAMIKKSAASNGADSALGDDEITAATELTSLGIDSLGLADILWDIEEAYGIRIELSTVDAWSNLQSVGDLIEGVRCLAAREV